MLLTGSCAAGPRRRAPGWGEALPNCRQYRAYWEKSGVMPSRCAKWPPLALVWLMSNKQAFEMKNYHEKNRLLDCLSFTALLLALGCGGTIDEERKESTPLSATALSDL